MLTFQILLFLLYAVIALKLVPTDRKLFLLLNCWMLVGLLITILVFHIFLYVTIAIVFVASVIGFMILIEAIKERFEKN